ncbi:Multicopper oxidase with three cupredoxin domains (includes cell division protein FtsP and spore coat protein CotA) [Nitrosospira briensis]|uniref:Multicopper oxidase with three cupredoxin domains (Includes cell division protein FtsP and spore coat protein CotA) n=1 Tax=Nitrosospira briensis TaxID=35799 RepID=A0A1I4XFT7_9PROT|nr:multicopper oxidase family protein [Nitrosospira briensis]SFN24343.1 Multicopper oxidase with three cupredoxin domains (includes cell division protein FtsP and spore coat protein CotA) [Nitrosospira briensis]
MSLVIRILPAFALSTIALFSFTPTAKAQLEHSRTVENPPLLDVIRQAQPRSILKGVPAPAIETALNLNVTYTNGKIWNPAEQRYDAVKLRSYQGKGVNPDTPYVSPTISIFPGETIQMTLNNKLPPDPTCSTKIENVNTPHCFNGTNLHTHGLWVNPAGNGDNVLISINPGVSFQYEYKVPSDHPAGTFWYHTHRHGSTALQVASGMAGALIIRGTRFPTQTANGDIDTLLTSTEAQPFTERLLVMQQIQYACRDARGKIKTNPDGSYRCDPGDVGGVEGYDQFGPGSWPDSGRYTSINGQVLPVFKGAKTGQIERWRVIHGGVRDTVNLRFRKLKEGSRSSARLTAAQHDAYVKENCTGPALPQYLIAADGLTTKAVIKTDVTVYQPAYRWDTLMVFPQSGVYCVVDDAAPASASVEQTAPSRQLLGFVRVDQGRPVPGDITRYLTSELVSASRLNMPGQIQGKVESDLRDGLKLTKFVPHADIKDNEVTGTQEMTFNIDVNQSPTQFQVNGKPYDPGRIDRVLKLGGVDEWTLKSDFVSHPFHIHINPFQIVKILDPNGKDVSAADAVDSMDTTDGIPDPQYRALKGVWKDTIWVKNLVPPGSPPGQYTVVVRTRYQRYIGDFVLHCHILDHEDQGMMQNVRIALPDGAGNASLSHH